MNTATWSADVERGLDHPDSVAARKERARARSDAETGRNATLQHALYLLRRSCWNLGDAVLALHCISAALSERDPLAVSGEAETIAALDSLADEIEYH